MRYEPILIFAEESAHRLVRAGALGGSLFLAEFVLACELFAHEDHLAELVAKVTYHNYNLQPDPYDISVGSGQ